MDSARSICVLALFGILASGCETTSTVSDEGDPVKLMRPEQELSVLVVNRMRLEHRRTGSLRKNRDDLKRDALKAIVYQSTGSGRGGRAPVYTTSELSLPLRGQFKFRERRDWEDWVKPIHVDSIELQDVGYHPRSGSPTELDKKEIQALAYGSASDVVLVIEMEKSYCVDVSRRRRSGYDDRNTCYLECTGEALFRIYDGLTGLVEDEWWEGQTVQKEFEMEEEEECLRNEPEVRGLAMGIVASTYLDYMFLNGIKPIAESRMEKRYGVPGSKVMEAMEFADFEQWESAEAIWKESLEKSEDAATKAKVLYNLAYSAAKQGEYDLAKERLLKSYELKPEPQAMDFLVEISKWEQELAALL